MSTNIVRKNARYLIEFVLVVVGVLFALMIEVILENRQDSTERAAYVSRLIDDIESDKVSIENRIEFFTGVRQFSADVYEWLDTDVPVDNELLLAAFYAAEVFPHLTIRNTYEDLHNTGNIRLLQDIDLRTALSEYYVKADSSRLGWTPTVAYREIIRGVIPPAVQDTIRTLCPSTTERDEVPTGFPPCPMPGIDFEHINTIFAELKGDQDFRRKLIYRDSELGVILFLLQQQLSFADDALGLLRKQGVSGVY